MNTVNKPFRKKDAMQLVTGQPVYMDDLVPADCLIVKLLRSPHANAIVKSINTAVAKKVPGIEAIFTWEDVPQDARRYTQAGQTYPEASPYDRLLIDRHVRFVGDVVAIVAGKDDKCVDKALKMIKGEYEVLEPVLDYHTAKDTMINASNVAMEFHQALPITARPETTEGRQGFYHLCQMYGDVTTAKLGYILRDHDADKLQYKKDNLLHIADYLNGKYGPGTVEVEIKDSYRNMLEKIKPHFHLVETARKATRMAGLEPEEIPVRGGTDGAMLSWKGLPCPNLGTGGFNFHGVCECITAERMDRCTEILLNIIKLYAE